MQYLKKDIVFFLVFLHFLTYFFIIFHEYANEIILYRTRSSINLSYDITGLIIKCHNDSFGPEISSFVDF